jgi:hypothetical protein
MGVPMRAAACSPAECGVARLWLEGRPGGTAAGRGDVARLEGITWTQAVSEDA